MSAFFPENKGKKTFRPASSKIAGKQAGKIVQ